MNNEISIRAISCNPELPLISCDPEIAEDAWEVYAILMRAFRDDPDLRNNSLFCFYCKQSRERFMIAFGASS